MSKTTPNTQPLTSFGVGNFRCFDAEGFRLLRPARVNVMIGKNNAGKSNVLRAIELFAEACGVTGRKLTYPLEANSHHRDRNAYIFRATVGYDHLQQVPPDRYRWDAILPQIKEALPNGIEVEFAPGGKPSDDAWKQSPFLNAGLDYSAAQRFVQAISGKQFTSAPHGRNLVALLHEGLIRQVSRAGQEMLADPLFIPVPRQFTTVGSSDQSAELSSFDGRGVIGDLRQRQHPDPGKAGEEARKSFDDLQQFVRDLLDEPTLVIEVPPFRDELMVRIREDKFDLAHFGTGLHHLILMCAAFAIHRRRTVYLEEPEIHLHPDLQRKFFRFLLDRTDNRYFITTHSPVFLDESSGDQVAVYHVNRDDRRTEVTRVSTPETVRGILRDIGCKPSDLLLVNGVIWVEGPSDRIYLLKWLEFAAPEFREGKHFAISLYGGSLLTHYGFADDTALVPALQMNPNVIVIVDRDAASGQPPAKKWVSRVQTELGDRCWVTDGWEVENYVREERVRAAYAGQVKNEIQFGPDDQLDKVLQNGRIGTGNLSCGKMDMAKMLSVVMTADDLEYLDLRARLNQLIAAIHSWNQLGGGSATPAH
jgi:putative ATP-dependent endonuclease of the OLD family